MNVMFLFAYADLLPVAFGSVLDLAAIVRGSDRADVSSRLRQYTQKPMFF